MACRLPGKFRVIPEVNHRQSKTEMIGSMLSLQTLVPLRKTYSELHTRA